MKNRENDEESLVRPMDEAIFFDIICGKLRELGIVMSQDDVARRFGLLYRGAHEKGQRQAMINCLSTN